MSFFKKVIIFLPPFLISYFLFLITPSVFAQETQLSPAVPGTINEIIARIIKVVLGLVGVLALMMFIYGGVTWMTSGGNVEQVKKGKNTLVWAILGLAVIFFAYSLVEFILRRILGVEG